MAQNTKRQQQRQRQARRQRRRKANARPTHLQTLAGLREWFLPDDAPFSHLSFHANTQWLPQSLVWLTLCWSWSESRNLTDGFTEALGYCQKMFVSAAVNTYQGLMSALVIWTPSFLPLLQGVLQQRMEQVGGKFWRPDGWVPIAFDGSRSTAPRTVSNEVHFCAPNPGKSNTAKHRRKKRAQQKPDPPVEPKKSQPQEPQVWITMMWHMGLRLPWSWRLGPSNASERDHVMSMVGAETFPENTLFCGDAGFVGYPLWSRLIERGNHFLVRVGGNVSLLSEQVDWTYETMGDDTHVLCWPKTARDSDRPPLRLRLIQARLGKTPVWLLTSVLDRRQLTLPQAVRFYPMRWGIEIEFRGLKQTLERAQLRCRNPRRLLVELDWSILGMAVAELLAIKEQRFAPTGKSGDDAPRLPVDPAKRSLARTMRALRKCLRHLNEVPEPGQDLLNLLRTAVTDSYERKGPKGARYRPPNPDKKPLGDPKLRRLEQPERKKLEKMAA